MSLKAKNMLNVAVVGGGPGCLALMDMISMDRFRQLRMNLVGIADINPDAPALLRARSSGIYTTGDYHDLFDIPNLDLIMELTGSKEVSIAIQSEKPAHVQMIDHAVTRMFWDFFRLEDDKLQAEEKAEKQLEKEVKERSRELKASEEETRLQRRTAEGIIYGSPTPMFVVDKNHKIIYWNRACEKLTGFRSEEMIGTDRHWAPFYSRKRPLLADVIIDNDTERLEKATRTMNLRKSPIVEGGYEAEVFVPHLGEGGTHLYLNTALIKDDAGNTQGAIVTYLDFSERVRMTKELKESEEETRLQKRTAEGIIYGSPIPMFVLDKDHKITHWNNAVEKLTGFRSEDMIGTDRQWEPFYHDKRPILADLIIDNEQKKIEKLYGHMNLSRSTVVDGAYEAEHFFSQLGEGGIHLYLNAAPIRDDSGNIRGAIVTYQDFSEREKMLLEIKRRETFVQNLIHNSIDGIIATEAKGTIVIFNRGAVEILGYRPEEIIGRMTYPEILSEETDSAIRDAFYGNAYGPPGKIINMVGKLLNKANKEIPVRLSGTLIYEQEQEVGSVVFIQDLREIHRLQEEKEQAQRMAAIGRTVAGVAHYIKNILTGLQGGSYVINSAISRKDLELVKKGWNMVEKNIDQIAHIVTDMLIYSTQRKPDYRVVDPNELIGEILELVEERAMTSGVTLVKELQPGLPMVNMDKTGIHRALLNLVSNAIDACTLEGIISGKGFVTIKTDSPPGWGVRYSVSDNGTGMDEETKERLFTDFFTTKGYKGTGLGLPVTRKIIEEHGGRLTFESRADHGTTFTLMLPP